MSTTTVPSALTPATTPPRLDRPVGFVGVLRSEWLKLRSLRSNTAVLIGTAAIMLLVGSLFSAFVGGVLDGGGAEGGELTCSPCWEQWCCRPTGPTPYSGTCRRTRARP